MSISCIAFYASICLAIQVNSIVGVAANMPVVFNPPLTFSIDCVVSCPTLSAPSFTDETRVWGMAGPGCRTSTDRGETWANCAGAPAIAFTSASSIAEASDGSIVMGGRPTGDVPNSCAIYRSTDVGASWATVYTGANFCTFVGGEADANHMTCLASGECVFIFRNTASSLGTVLRSVDNGATWATEFTTAGAVGNIHTIVYDGTAGGAYGNAGSTYMRYTGGGWSTTSLAAGYQCWGSMIQNGQPYTTCQNLSQVAALDGITGLVDRVFTIANPFLFSNLGILSYGYSNQVIYVYTSTPVGGQVSISLDNGASFVVLLSTAQNVRGGTSYRHPVNGCVYFHVTSSRIVGFC